MLPQWIIEKKRDGRELANDRFAPSTPIEGENTNAVYALLVSAFEATNEPVVKKELVYEVVTA